jgi:hypothetical protein
MKKWLCALALVLAAVASGVLLLGQSADVQRQAVEPWSVSTFSVLNLEPFQVLYANERLTEYTAAYTSQSGEKGVKDIQCPIPMKDRVFNKTGIQCVYASIETIGRWAEEPKLMNPPLTSRPECKSYSSPSRLAQVLNSLKVKYEQSYGKRDEGRSLIRKAMDEGRGCLWGVPGHAMVIVHWDEENNVYKWVDNSDRSLKVQTGTIQQFEKRWDSWICVVYADNDIILKKMNKITLPNQIPIKDRNGVQGKYPNDYIPSPQKR